MLRLRGKCLRKEEGAADVDREYDVVPAVEVRGGVFWRGMRKREREYEAIMEREEEIGTMRNEAYAIVGVDKGGWVEGTLQTDAIELPEGVLRADVMYVRANTVTEIQNVQLVFIT